MLCHSLLLAASRRLSPTSSSNFCTAESYDIRAIRVDARIIVDGEYDGAGRVRTNLPLRIPTGIDRTTTGSFGALNRRVPAGRAPEQATEALNTPSSGVRSSFQGSARFEGSDCRRSDDGMRQITV
jgi:hypothetical protein